MGFEGVGAVDRHELSPCYGRPRPSRPCWRSGNRRRAGTAPEGPERQRRMAGPRVFCCARKPAEARPCAGGRRAGKKLGGPPLRPRREGGLWPPDPPVDRLPSKAGAGPFPERRGDGRRCQRRPPRRPPLSGANRRTRLRSARTGAHARGSSGTPTSCSRTWRLRRAGPRTAEIVVEVVEGRHEVVDRDTLGLGAPAEAGGGAHAGIVPVAGDDEPGETGRLAGARPDGWR